MPITNIRSSWSSGDLIFHESTSVHPSTTYNVLKIADDAVKIGDTGNDIDFQYYGTGSISAIIDCGNATFTLTGIEMKSAGTGGSASTKAFTSTGYTINNANLGDGYGANEFELNTTGAVAGHVAGVSAWVNVNSTVAAGGNIVTPQNNGIWVNSGDSGDTSNALVAYGGRFQYIGDNNAAHLALFSVNLSGGDTCEGIFSKTNGLPTTELGYVEDATTDSSKCGDIPIFVDMNTGTQYWIRVYDSSS